MEEALKRAARGEVTANCGSDIQLLTFSEAISPDTRQLPAPGTRSKAGQSRTFDGPLRGGEFALVFGRHAPSLRAAGRKTGEILN